MTVTSAPASGSVGAEESSADLWTVLQGIEVDPDRRVVRIAGQDPIELPDPDEDGESFSVARLLPFLLADRLYDLLHAGRPPQATRGMPRSWRDADLERRFAAAMPHRTTTVATTAVAAPGDASAGEAIVVVDGVRLRLPLSTLRDLDDRSVAALPPAGGEVPVIAVLPAGRPGLSPGFYLADGSRGRGHRGAHLLRLYVHLTDPVAAPDVWGAALSILEDAGAHYRAKIASSRRLYPRQDALVIYLAENAWSLVRPIADRMADLPGRGSTTSLLAQRISDGVAVAFEPQDARPGQRGLSFGEHRTRALAAGLVEGADVPPADRLGLIQDALRAAHIDPSALWRNTGSPALDVLIPTGLPGGSPGR